MTLKGHKNFRRVIALESDTINEAEFMGKLSTWQTLFDVESQTDNPFDDGVTVVQGTVRTNAAADTAILKQESLQEM